MEGGSMDLTKISSSDRIVLVGFVLTFIGTLGPWWVVSYGTGGTSSANGWHVTYLGWLVVTLCLVAAALALSKLLNLTLPLPAALPILACGALSVLLVLIRLLTLRLPANALGTFGHRGWGIWLTLVGSIVVAFGGFLKNGEPAR